jgi:hypothetical protein
MTVQVSGREVRVAIHPGPGGPGGPGRVGCGTEVRTLSPGETATFAASAEAAE